MTDILIVEKIHFAATFSMLGVIWVVQLLQYPSFLKITSNDDFLIYHNEHSAKISWIVAPLMTIELISALSLSYENMNWFYVVSFCIIAFIFLWTGLVSVPLHNDLSQELPIDVRNRKILKLIRTNWFRTVLWTCKAIVLICV